MNVSDDVRKVSDSVGKVFREGVQMLPGNSQLIKKLPKKFQDFLINATFPKKHKVITIVHFLPSQKYVTYMWSERSSRHNNPKN